MKPVYEWLNEFRIIHIVWFQNLIKLKKQKKFSKTPSAFLVFLIIC
jgi:hypothetical protein